MPNILSHPQMPQPYEYGIRVSNPRRRGFCLRVGVVSATMKPMETNAESSAEPQHEESALMALIRRYPPELWMVVAAFLFRILLLAVPGIIQFDELKDDMSFINEMSQTANSMYSGQGFSAPFIGGTGPTAWIPPVYPWLCFLIFKLVGGWGTNGTAAVVSVLVMNSVFSALTCIPLVRIAERLFNRRVALISGWAWAVVPYFAKWSLTWIWEITLSTLLMMWLFDAAMRLRDDDKTSRWVIYGLVWGLAMLTNPAILTLVGLCMLWLLQKRGLRVWKHMALCALICGLVISPWLLRNHYVMHKWIFIRSNFGFELHLGNFHGSPASCLGTLHPWGSNYELQQYRSLGEVEYVNGHMQAAKQFIRQYPGEFIHLCWRRFLAAWDGRAMMTRHPWRQIWLPWLYPILTGTTIGGLFLMWYKRKPVTTLIFLILLLYPWPYYIACVQTRFRHLVDPLMLMITVYLLLELVGFILHRKGGVPEAQPAA